MAMGADPRLEPYLPASVKGEEQTARALQRAGTMACEGMRTGREIRWST
jgi:hypothetical protein